jgi:glycerol-3-phosphate dehydrogenase
MIANPEGTVDLLVVGGGINGAGIACDAAGRGLRVALCEQDDLASATSSASSKLIHGGLRYLEHF